MLGRTKAQMRTMVLEYEYLHLPKNCPVLWVNIPAPWSIWEVQCQGCGADLRIILRIVGG